MFTWGTLTPSWMSLCLPEVRWAPAEWPTAGSSWWRWRGCFPLSWRRPPRCNGSANIRYYFTARTVRCPYCAVSSAWPWAGLRFSLWLLFFKNWHAESDLRLFLCLHYVYLCLVITNESEVGFLFWHIFCDTQRNRRLHTRGRPKVSLRPKHLRFFIGR